MLARVCLSFPPDCYVNPTVFDVIGDRHVAQRNIHVVQMAQQMELLSFGFRIVNALPRDAAFMVGAAEVIVERNVE